MVKYIWENFFRSLLLEVLICILEVLRGSAGKKLGSPKQDSFLKQHLLTSVFQNFFGEMLVAGE